MVLSVPLPLPLPVVNSDRVVRGSDAFQDPVC
jgi:hypothetical protein